MYKSAKIGVIVPAYNEEKLIGKVIETIPEFVDRIIVVDDASTDNTGDIVKGYQNNQENRLFLIQHDKNQGVGGAIVSGYKQVLNEGLDIAVVMAGDGQMDPNDLMKLIEPVATGNVDYTKGNRLLTGNAWQIIPKIRYLGNSLLSLLTKIASGYWHVVDSQSGYTATTSNVLKMLNLDKIYKRYGMPNDMLVKLNIYNFKVKDIPVNPIYNIGEKSGIKVWTTIFTLSFLLFKLFWYRLFQKYIIRDFHPLIFFYLMAFTLLPAGISLGIAIVVVKGYISLTILMFCVLLLISGFQALFFAMWFDMEYNKELR
ncbi:MAG: glycosyltransferase family 2 protein [bacterium]